MFRQPSKVSDRYYVKLGGKPPAAYKKTDSPFAAVSFSVECGAEHRITGLRSVLSVSHDTLKTDEKRN